eukprot:gene120-113_t
MFECRCAVCGRKEAAATRRAYELPGLLTFVAKRFGGGQELSYRLGYDELLGNAFTGGFISGILLGNSYVGGLSIFPQKKNAQVELESAGQWAMDGAHDKRAEPFPLHDDAGAHWVSTNKKICNASTASCLLELSLT